MWRVWGTGEAYTGFWWVTAGNMWHRLGRGEMLSGFWYRDLKEGDHLGMPECWWRDNIKMDLKEVEW
jgi:hypothetical protein